MTGRRERRARGAAPARRREPADRRAVGRRRLPRRRPGCCDVLPPGSPRAVLGPRVAGVVPRVADEAALVEPQLRARARPAARRPARPPAGPARLPRLRALPRRADAPAVPAARRGRGARRADSTPIEIQRIWRDARRRRPDLHRRARRQQRRGRGGHRPPRACRSASSPTTRRSPSCSSCSARSASSGARRSSRGATCGRSSACSAGASCSACWSTGAIAATGSRSSCSAPGRRCRPGRRRSPPRPARGSCPITIRRQPRRPASTSRWPSRSRSPSTDPAELQRATQAIADALADDDPRRARSSGTASSRSGRRPRPRAADLERRARRDAGRSAATRARPRAGRATRPTRPRRDRARGASAVTIRGRLMLTRLVAGLPPARGPALPARPSWPATCWYRLTPGRAAQARRNLRRVVACARRLAAEGRPRVARPRAIRARSSASSARPSATTPGTTSRWRATPASTRADVDERLAIETPELIAEAVVPGEAVLFVGLHFGVGRAARAVPRLPGRRDGRRRWRPSTTRAAGLVRADPRRRRASGSSACARRAASCSTRSATASRSASSATAT